VVSVEEDAALVEEEGTVSVGGGAVQPTMPVKHIWPKGQSSIRNEGHGVLT